MCVCVFVCKWWFVCYCVHEYLCVLMHVGVRGCIYVCVCVWWGLPGVSPGVAPGQAG